MPRHFSPTFLRLLRNQVPINTLIATVLKIPTKDSENHLRFLCPICGDFHTATNPKTNLARCFRCQKNFNPIDMVMIVNDSSFIEAVRFLKPLLPSETSNLKIYSSEDKPKKTSSISSGVGGIRLKIKPAGLGGVKSPYCAISCERKVPFNRA